MNELAGIRAISFDLDDTLWDCAAALKYAEAESYAWLREHAPRIVEVHNEQSLLEHRMQVYAAHPELHVDVTVLRRLALTRLLEEHDYSASLVDALFDRFYRARSCVELFEGVHELLNALSSRYRLAAITNGNADLGLIGLDHFFDSIHRASLDHAPKPAPQMFEACMETFGIGPEALLHVGDNPDTDVGGAHAVGAQAVWYNPCGESWPAELAPPRYEVRNLAELRRLLT